LAVTPASAADLPEITAFWQARAETAMFPLNNLRRHGLAGDHPLSLHLWLRRQHGRVSDVLAVTRAGMVMPCFSTDAAPAAAQVLQGQMLIGILGPQAAARALEAAAGLQPAPRSLDHDEPHFTLDLTALHFPPGPGTLIPLDQAPEPVVREWMLDYQLTALNTPADLAPERVEDAYRRMVAADSHRVLMDEKTPLAMTGFNAMLPDIVQIGGVYTPPALRGKGHARRALALHLGQARSRGVQRATLFAASEMAARAYLAVGFRRIGTWTLLLFRGAQKGGG
jgi:GNAT superfamily N-acetyltransferase